MIKRVVTPTSVNVLPYEAVLEALLVRGAVGNELRLPSSAKFILSEVVNGCLSHTGSNLVGRVLWLQYPGVDRDERSFARNLFELLLQTQAGEPMDRVGAAILTLAKPEQIHSPPERPYMTTALESIYCGLPGQIYTGGSASSWSLPSDLVLRVNKKVMPTFSGPEQQTIKNIGRAMQPFVEIDLRHIRKTHIY